MDKRLITAAWSLLVGVRDSADWALELPSEGMRTIALETVGMKFLHQDLDGAVDWAGSIADRPDAHEAVADVADEMASRNPQEAATWPRLRPPRSPALPP